ncbi:hypothetical protein cyc_05104 [Cyclospora cayetanensis]|uniref:Uncharacterized protein n=1 Tax=Cyclospora cayetanensis TaxID=88456 RepID=A0A1D3CZ88_9EIME|nr:hypothetical protein cyc_05104 [Cyclospora cayetanensis]
MHPSSPPTAQTAASRGSVVQEEVEPLSAIHPLSRSTTCCSSQGCLSESSSRRDTRETEALLRVALQPAEVLLDRTTALLAALAEPEVYREHWKEDADDVVCYCLRLGFLRQQAEATPGAAVPGIAAVEPAQQKQGWQAEGPQKEEQQLTASVGRCSCCCCSRCSEREVASLPFAPCLFDRPAATETLEQQQMEAAALTQDVLAYDVPPVAFMGPPPAWMSIHLRRDEDASAEAGATTATAAETDALAAATALGAAGGAPKGASTAKTAAIAHDTAEAASVAGSFEPIAFQTRLYGYHIGRRFAAAARDSALLLRQRRQSRAAAAVAAKAAASDSQSKTATVSPPVGQGGVVQRKSWLSSCCGDASRDRCSVLCMCSCCAAADAFLGLLEMDPPTFVAVDDGSGTRSNCCYLYQAASYVSELCALADSLIRRLCEFACPSSESFCFRPETAVVRGTSSGSSSNKTNCGSCEQPVAIGLRWREDFFSFELYAAVEQRGAPMEGVVSRDTETCCWKLMRHEVLQPCVLDAVSIHLTFSEALRRLAPWLQVQPRLLQLLQQTSEGQRVLVAAALRSCSFIQRPQQQQEESQRQELVKGDQAAFLDHPLLCHKGSEKFHWTETDSACQWTEQTLHSHAAGAMSDAPATSERVRALNLDEAVQRLALLSSPLADSPTGDIAALNSMVEEQSKQNSQREPLNQWEHQPVLRETELVSSGARTSSTGQVSTSVAQSSISECHGERGRNYQCTAPEAEDLVASYFNHVRQLHEAHSFSDRVCSFGSTADCLDISSVCTVALRLLGADKKHQYCDMLTPTNHCYCSVKCSAEGNIFGVATQSTKPASIGLLKAILPLPEDVHVQRGKQQRHHRPGFACEYIGVTDVATGDTLTVSLLLTLLLPTQRMLLPWDIHWAPRTAGLSSTEGAAAETERLVCTAEPTRHSLPECMSRRSTACGVSPSNGGWCCGRTCICSCCNDNSSCADAASSEWQKASSVILSASPGDLGPTTEVFQLVSDVLGPLLLPAQQKQQHCKLMQQSVGAEVSGPQEPLRTPLAPQGGQGEESSASSTAGSSTVWARTVSGGVSLRVTSAEEASSSLESDSEGAPVSPFMQQERQQQGPLPSAGSLVLPPSLAAPQGDEGCAGAEDSCGVMIDALRDLVGFVRIGAEVDVGFPISAELLEEAGEELHAICRVGATQSPLSPGTPSTDAGVTGAGSGGLTQQAQLLDVSLSLEAPDAAERCRATSLWSEGPASLSSGQDGGLSDRSVLAGKTSSGSSLAPGGKTSGRSSNRSGNNTPTGVYFDAARQLWRCQWRSEGRLRSKGFAVSSVSIEEGINLPASLYPPVSEPASHPTAAASGAGTATWAQPIAVQQAAAKQSTAEERRLLEATISSSNSKGAVVSESVFAAPQFASTAVQPPLTTAAAVTQLQGERFLEVAGDILSRLNRTKEVAAVEKLLQEQRMQLQQQTQEHQVLQQEHHMLQTAAKGSPLVPDPDDQKLRQLLVSYLEDALQQQQQRMQQLQVLGDLDPRQHQGSVEEGTLHQQQMLLHRVATLSRQAVQQLQEVLQTLLHQPLQQQHQGELRQVASQRAIPGEGSAQAVGMATAKGGEQQQQGRTRILTLAPCILEGQNREDSGNTADQGDEGAAKRLRVAPDSV